MTDAERKSFFFLDTHDVEQLIFFDREYCSPSCKHVGGSLARVVRAVMVVGGCAGEGEEGRGEQMVKNSQGLFQESSVFTAHILT